MDSIKIYKGTMENNAIIPRSMGIGGLMRLFTGYFGPAGRDLETKIRLNVKVKGTEARFMMLIDNQLPIRDLKAKIKEQLIQYLLQQNSGIPEYTAKDHGNIEVFSLERNGFAMGEFYKVYELLDDDSVIEAGVRIDETNAIGTPNFGALLSLTGSEKKLLETTPHSEKKKEDEMKPESQKKTNQVIKTPYPVVTNIQLEETASENPKKSLTKRKPRKKKENEGVAKPKKKKKETPLATNKSFDFKIDLSEGIFPSPIKPEEVVIKKNEKAPSRPSTPKAEVTVQDTDVKKEVDGSIKKKKKSNKPKKEKKKKERKAKQEEIEKIERKASEAEALHAKQLKEGKKSPSKDDFPLLVTPEDKKIVVNPDDETKTIYQTCHSNVSRMDTFKTDMKSMKKDKSGGLALFAQESSDDSSDSDTPISKSLPTKVSQEAVKLSKPLKLEKPKMLISSDSSASDDEGDAEDSDSGKGDFKLRKYNEKDNIFSRNQKKLEKQK